MGQHRVGDRAHVVREHECAAGEVVPTEHHALDRMQPVIAPIDRDKALKEEFERWKESRGTFNKNLSEREPETVKQGWQRNYMRGRDLDGSSAAMHVTKRKLSKPTLVE